MSNIMIADILVLALVFAAVTWGVWIITPVLAQIGLEQSAGKHVKSDGRTQLGPIYRFTTPERLSQSCWSAALLGCGTLAAILIACNVLNPYLLCGCSLLAAALFFQIPKWWLKKRIKRRQQLFDARLTDLTLGIANGLRAGAALPQSLELVSRDARVYRRLM